MAKDLDFYFITDLHHYSRELGTEGKAFERISGKDEKCLSDTGDIIDAYFDMLIADKDTEIILVGGDVSYDGAMESHRELVPRFRRLKDAGKRVFVITATHDYYVEGNQTGHAMKCAGGELVPATRTSREELIDLYGEFGMDEAISIHKESHSYCVKLQDGYRLLCLNDDGDRVFCGYSEDQIRWIDEQIDSAKEAGDYIFGMTHHPSLPPSAIYPAFSARDMLGDWDKTTTHLADKGLKFMFTGHTHMMNIGRKVTENGNEYYDINTPSMVGYPTAIRKVKIDDEKVDIKSVSIESFGDGVGKEDIQAYFRENFQFFINDILDSAAYNYDHLAKDLSTSFSMTPEKMNKLKPLLHPLGKSMQKLTFKKMGRLLCIRSKVDKSIEDRLLKDFLLEVISNVFYGNEPYYPDTPEYKAVDAAINRAKGLLRFKRNKEELYDMMDLVLRTLYNEEPEDWEGVFER